VAFGFLLVLMVVYHVVPSPQILLLPLFVAGTMIVAAAAGILFSALIVSYRDFRYVITYVVQLWLFATPVLYALDIIPAKWRLLYAVNPMVGMIAGFRGAVLGGALPLDVIAVGFVAAAILLGLALRYFTTSSAGSPMSSEAITISGVAKRYVIGQTQQATQFRESLVSMISAPFRRLRRLAGKDSADTTEFWALNDVSFNVGVGDVVASSAERRGQEHAPQDPVAHHAADARLHRARRARVEPARGRHGIPS